MTARQWLRAHGYCDVADVIDSIMLEWRTAGKKTRRNWWEVLAGGRDGRPRTIAGRVFPVLVSAQKHQGIKVTPNAIQRSENEVVPEQVYLGKNLRKRQ